jgi:hypothetical protein
MRRWGGRLIGAEVLPSLWDLARGGFRVQGMNSLPIVGRPCGTGNTGITGSFCGTGNAGRPLYVR